MAGAAKGWALQQITLYEEGSYPEWADITVGTSEDVVMTPGLQMLISHQFMRGDRPEYMLKQLHECKQGSKDMEDFLVEFENLKLLSNISSDHAMKILQSNVP